MISLYSDMKRMFTREPAQQILPSNSGDLVHSGQVTHPRQSVAPRRDNRYQHRAPRLSALRPERNPAGDLRVLAVRHDEAIPRSRHAPPPRSRHTPLPPKPTPEEIFVFLPAQKKKAFPQTRPPPPKTSRHTRLRRGRQQR